MHYYRYRPFNEVSLKELFYSEMYFSSPEECNDPFDSKTFYIFGNDKQKWARVVKLASEIYKIPISNDLLNKITDHICSQCPLTFDEAVNRNLFGNYGTNSTNESSIVGLLSNAIREILEIYKPATRYFVSMSKENSEPLMWSHYADKHRGYCLIFKAINGELLTSPNYKKDQISRATPNGIAAHMSYSLPDKFTFSSIDYKSEVEHLNAFMNMPVFVTGDVEDEKEKEKLNAERESHYFQKSKHWSYENESRLILRPPYPFLFGGHIEFSKEERLFHFEPSQLVGIIYGARMTKEEKNRIRQILKARENWIDRTSNYKKTVFHFFEFEAKLSPNQRDVEIEPINLLSYNVIPKTDKEFERHYNDWKDGVGWVREGGRSTRTIVK